MPTLYADDDDGGKAASRERLLLNGWTAAGKNLRREQLWKDPDTGASLTQQDALERLRRRQISDQDYQD